LWLFALRIILIPCTTIVAVCTENYTDILPEYCGYLHWELYWYSSWVLWLFALRIILISCTNIVAVCTLKPSDILHEDCGCLHLELYCYSAQTVHVVVTGSQYLFSDFSSLCHTVFFIPSLRHFYRNVSRRIQRDQWVRGKAQSDAATACFGHGGHRYPIRCQVTPVFIMLTIESGRVCRPDVSRYHL